MFRKMLLTGMLGIGTIVGVTATPTTAEAGCRPARVVYHRGYRRLGGDRYIAPRVIYRPVIVNPCP